MKKLIMCFTFILLTLSCNTTEPPPPVKTITLTLEDAASVEAWIKLTTTNLQLPATVTLQQNDLTRRTINLVKPDTLLYIDSLLPNTTYTYHAAMQPSNQAEVKSNVLSVITMDTTSHNFTWQTFTFGEHSSSVLFDVAIIDENNIWAVGEIYLNDSLGNPDPTFYNAAHWDGQNWELKRIFYEGGIWTISTIFAFNENDIWFSAFVRCDGENFIELPIPNILTGWRINKIWGTSSEDLYIVGNNGNIAHYSGPTGGWQKIESGTDVMLRDITGESTAGEKWFSGYNPFGSHYSILIQLKNLTPLVVWESQNLIDTPPYGLTIESIYAFNDLLFVASNEGIFRTNTRLDLPPQKLTSNPIKRYRISGSGQNDVYTVGSNSAIIHYNGMGWKKIYENYQNTSVLYSAATRNNTTVSVGTIVIDAIYHKAQIILSTNY